MSRLKRWLAQAGLPQLVGPLYGGRGAILVFHRIRARDPHWLFETNHRNSVAPEAFEALLDALAESGVAVVTLDEALERLAAPRAGRFACLTFDDGYRDNHDVLLPIVTARGIPVTIYVAPGLLDGSAPLWWYGLDQVIAQETRLWLPLDGGTEIPIATPAEKEQAFGRAVAFMLRADRRAAVALTGVLADRYGVDFAALAARHMMDRAMLRRLAASPLVEIGAHTLTHPSLAALSEAEARSELERSRAWLAAEIGKPVRHLAYPFGAAPAVSAREVRLAAEAGYATAVTAYPGNLFRAHLGHRHALPRHGVGPGDGSDALALKLAGLRRLSRASYRPVVTLPS